MPGKRRALFLRQLLLVLGVKLPKKIEHLAFQVESENTDLDWLLIRCLEQKSKRMFSQNGGVISIYHGTICKKSRKKTNPRKQKR